MVFKMTVFMTPMMEMIRKAMPNLKLCYNLRHPMPCLVSYYKFFQARNAANVY